jgi:hypothetical protein
MMSRWCPECVTSWPVGDVRCPACTALTRIAHAPPIHTAEEAKAAAERRRYRAHRKETTEEFERLYAEREEQRIAAGYLAPEAIGKREARAILDLESQFVRPE